MEATTRWKVNRNEVSAALIACRTFCFNFHKASPENNTTGTREPTCATGKGEGPGGQGKLQAKGREPFW